MSRHDLVSAQDHAEDMAAVKPFMTAKPVSYETFSLSQRQYPWRFCVSTKGWVLGRWECSSQDMVVSGLDAWSEPRGPFYLQWT